MRGGGNNNYEKTRFVFLGGFKSLKMNVYFFNFYLVFCIFVITDDFSY